MPLFAIAIACELNPSELLTIADTKNDLVSVPVYLSLPSAGIEKSWDGEKIVKEVAKDLSSVYEVVTVNVAPVYALLIQIEPYDVANPD